MHLDPHTYHPDEPRRYHVGEPWAEKLHVNGPTPDSLFKFCKFSDYVNHISNGKFRLGNLAYYREAYEKNKSGFGDPLDGVFTHFGAPFTVQMPGRWHALSFSQSYSFYMHKRWFERKDCEYSVCVEFDAKPLLAALGESLRDHDEHSRIIIVRPCTYGQNTNAQIDRYYMFSEAHMKPYRYRFEDEYRLAAHIPPNAPEGPLDIKIDNVDRFIKRAILVPFNG